MEYFGISHHGRIWQDLNPALAPLQVLHKGVQKQGRESRKPAADSAVGSYLRVQATAVYLSLSNLARP